MKSKSVKGSSALNEIVFLLNVRARGISEKIPSPSDHHTHEDDEYESFLAWMVNIPYHDYRDG